MNVTFDKRFNNSIDKFENKTVAKKTIDFIELCETSKDLSSISGLRKMADYPTLYYIRIGNYRIGFEYINNNSIHFIIIAHRKEIDAVFS